MTKKKRVIVSLSDEAYKILNSFIGLTWILNGKPHTINTKSKAIEVLLIELKEQENDKSKK